MKTVSCDPVQLYAAPSCGHSGPPVRVTNLDTVNPVRLGPDTEFCEHTNSLPPQRSVTYDGSRDVWASTLDHDVTVKVDAGPAEA